MNTKGSRSPIAPLSRLKMDVTPTLKMEYEQVETESMWIEYTRMLNTYLTTYPNRKDYFGLAEVMKEELAKRALL